MIVLAEVLTNCEDDEYRRVKVKSPHVWEESDLMPSLGTIYLNVGDQVIVDISDGVDNAYIRGKIRNRKQKDEVSRSDVDGVLLYEAIKGEKWSAAWVNETNGVVTWKNSDGVTLEVNGTNISVTTEGDIQVKCSNASVEATTNVNVKCEAANVEANSDITVKCSNANVESSTSAVKAENIELDGKVSFTHGHGVPDSKGPLCGLPQCLFSGAPHSSSETA